MKSVVRLFVFALVLLGGCARQIVLPGESVCPPLYDATALLTLREDDSSQRLILRTQVSDTGIVFVALDTLGAPLFTLQRAGDGADWQADVSKLYRGPAAGELIAAYSWWQRRAELTPECAAAAQLDLREDSEAIVLSHANRTWWRWHKAAPGQFEYADVLVRVNETRKEISE
ncbi:hypothetical protein [Gilvimarinus sp. DA14]|uniref:hypothetical protein n=1 Tax=Gilvimarinus sp. DA14 TaxID=2956798 RepID=UPI0020B823BB|nr:hypothetical protein [Gilvimarinus sp. DA14]UTF59734.1 hypothetical protein NHM04_14865 [Gilvimarinus sp. DA14]